MTAVLSHAGKYETLLAFSVACCARIEDVIPKQAAQDALNLLKSCISNNSTFESLQVTKEQLKSEWRHSHARAGGYHESQADAARASMQSHAASAIWYLVELSDDPDSDLAACVSDYVAQAVAYRDYLQDESPIDSDIPQMQADFLKSYNTEREAHCNILRRLHPKFVA